MIPIDLSRFLRAQEGTFDQALSEIRGGLKQSHWMWFIFPQFDGLGFSETARYYAIHSVNEATAYLEHPVLGSRLRECMEAVLAIQGHSMLEVFGTPDDLKLRSCATLFASVSPEESVFQQVLKKHFGGVPDEKTLDLLKQSQA